MDPSSGRNLAYALGTLALIVAIQRFFKGFMATVAVGLVLLSIGWLHAGGIVMALGFALAAVVRFVRPHDSGGLQVRSRGADVVFYLAAALNVLGAVLLVERLLPLRVVVLADVALLLTVAGVWWRGERDRRRVRP